MFPAGNDRRRTCCHRENLARDHNLAFVEIIEKVKEGGAINAVFVDAKVDRIAALQWRTWSTRSSTVLPRARSSQQRQGTARSECHRTPQQMLSSSLSLSRRRAASAQVAVSPRREPLSWRTACARDALRTRIRPGDKSQCIPRSRTKTKAAFVFSQEPSVSCRK